MRSIVIIVNLVMFTVVGCVSSAEPEAMTVVELNTSRKEVGRIFKNSIYVTHVSGGQKTVPFVGTSQIGNPDFKEALVATLRNVGLGAPSDTARYELAASIINVDQDLFSVDTKVITHIRYKITDRKSKSKVFEEKVSASHVTKFSEAFFGGTRLRLANEGSVRKNIEIFLKKLGQRSHNAIQSLRGQSEISTATPT